MQRSALLADIELAVIMNREMPEIQYHLSYALPLICCESVPMGGLLFNQPPTRVVDETINTLSLPLFFHFPPALLSIHSALPPASVCITCTNLATHVQQTNKTQKKTHTKNKRETVI